MIPLPRLQAVTRILTHANCPDGVASALILKDAIPSARVSFMSYGSEEHRTLVPSPGTLFCDFTPWLSPEPAKRETLIELWRNNNPVVLDHHPTARDLVEAFGDCGVFGLNEKSECGAWLAFHYVWKRFADEFDLSDDVGRAKVRHFAELAAVRDTWKTSDPRWDEAQRLSELLLFWRTEQPLEYYCLRVPSLTELGVHLLKKKLAAARTSIGEAHHFTTTRGTEGRMFQGVVTTSDAAELLEKEGEPLTVTHPDGSTERGAAFSRTDLVIGFHYKVDGGRLTLQFSMRSHAGYDVGAFAKSKPGGGGHKAAAGFTVEVSPELSANPYQLFKLLLEEWEGR